MAEIKGKVWNFGDNIDTDVIIPGRYLRTFNPKDLAEHVLEGERADFKIARPQTNCSLRTDLFTLADLITGDERCTC